MIKRILHSFRFFLLVYTLEIISCSRTQIWWALVILTPRYAHLCNTHCRVVASFFLNLRAKASHSFMYLNAVIY